MELSFLYFFSIKVNFLAVFILEAEEHCDVSSRPCQLIVKFFVWKQLSKFFFLYLFLIRVNFLAVFILVHIGSRGTLRCL